MKLCAVAILFVMLSAAFVYAGEARKSKVRRQFLHSLGITRTPKGCQVDHFLPIMCGGQDEIDNLRLICGQYKIDKEKAERHCDTLPFWKNAHPCQDNFCIRPMP